MTEYTSASKRFCSIYKSPRRTEMYVYMDRKMAVDDLPEVLRSMFGEPQHVMDLVLTENRKLARADARKVLEKIEEQGFYLQMPPAETDAPAGDVLPPEDSLHG